MPHNAELHSQVRALAHRLAAGQMSWADYREQRAVAVGAVTRGEAALVYEPPVVFGDPTTPKEHELSQNFIDLEALEREPRRWPAVVAVSALGIALVASGWVLWRVSQPPVVATAPVVVMSGAEAALDSFLKAGDWSEAALAETLAAWQGYSIEQRADARRTVAWRRLRSELRSQINQQQVLATVDETGEAQAQVERLVAFQEALQQ